MKLKTSVFCPKCGRKASDLEGHGGYDIKGSVLYCKQCDGCGTWIYAEVTGREITVRITAGYGRGRIL